MYDAPTHATHAQSTGFGVNGRTGRRAPLLVRTARRTDLAPATDLSTGERTAPVKTGRDSPAKCESAPVSQCFVKICVLVARSSSLCVIRCLFAIRQICTCAYVLLRTLEEGNNAENLQVSCLWS